MRYYNKYKSEVIAVNNTDWTTISLGFDVRYLYIENQTDNSTLLVKVNDLDEIEVNTVPTEKKFVEGPFEVESLKVKSKDVASINVLYIITGFESKLVG